MIIFDFDYVLEMNSFRNIKIVFLKKKVILNLFLLTRKYAKFQTIIHGVAMTTVSSQVAQSR